MNAAKVQKTSIQKTVKNNQVKKRSFREFVIRHEKVLGSIASLISIAMFFSLIEIFISNLQGKSNIFIMPLIAVANGFFWSMYAYGKKDWFLFVPNGLAVVLGSMTAISAFV